MKNKPLKSSALRIIHPKFKIFILIFCLVVSMFGPIDLASAAAPTVSSVSPNSGTNSGGTNITITGSNFQSEATGGTITRTGGYTIHTFNSGGTFTNSSALNVEILVVAGGGGGGNDNGGGGGAGGLVYNSSYAVSSGSHTVTVGNGGNATANGNNSVFESITAVGGGRGGNQAQAGATGGSGGGSNNWPSGYLAGGSNTSGQGNNGGAWPSSGYPYRGGGGGGAGAVGTDGGPSAGTGGIGLAYSISGTSTYYAGGGGGGSDNCGSDCGGAGGQGGGGHGGPTVTAGTANTGGGGGGGQDGGGAAAGGSGVVIIRYLTPSATVTFGGTSATNITVVNSTTITATTPAHANGQVDVVVTNNDGPGTLTNGFTYNNSPTVSLVSPNSGSNSGGTNVTVTGTNFIAPVTVTFGGASATNVNIVNPTTITATTPAHANGQVDVVVTNEDGSATLTNGFTYNNSPTISSVIPNSGLISGGANVTVTGTNFYAEATGGTITRSGGYTIHTFNSGGTFTNSSAMNVEILVVAGGGGGGTDNGGGGGAGGLVYNSSYAVSSGSHTVTVGNGGAINTNGNNSVFESITAVGGGRGGNQAQAGATGGSGGGSNNYPGGNLAGGSNTSGQGNNGGAWPSSGYPYRGGGGGGAGAVGTDGGPGAGTGGIGLAYSISGASVYYAGGGGGGSDTGQDGAAGGQGGGGRGGGGSGQAALVGTANTGGGGGGGVDTGGGGRPGELGAAGGSGIVIIRYLTPAVTFGGTPATNVTVVNPTTITATTPAHAAGQVNVVVTSPAGSATLTNGFTYSSSAYVPGSPTVNNPTISTLDVNPISGGAEKDMAIYAATGSSGNCNGTNGVGYIQANGSLSGSPVWQTDIAWGTVTVTGLSSGTTYYFCSKARDADDNETLFGSASSGITVGSLPTATLFTGPGATNFSLVGDITSVPGMKLSTSSGSIQWTNNVNASGSNFDTNVKIGTGFVSINKASLHSSVDAPAKVTIDVAGCDTYTVYYAGSFYNTLNDIKNNGQVCNASTTPACTNIRCVNRVLSFNVSHFDAYGGEGAAAGLETTVGVSNSPPTITITPSDGGSDATNPTTSGSNVTFTATAKDLNNNQYYLAICKTDAVTAGNNTSPTCPGSAWVISVEANSNAQASVNYTTQTGDAGNNDWYAFVCDKVAGTASCLPANGAGDQGFAIGSITFSEVPVDGATVTIDGTTYEFDTANNGVTGGNTEVDTSSSQGPKYAVTALVTANTGGIIGSRITGVSNIAYVYATAKGTAGNSIAMSEAGDTGDLITLSGANLTGGSDVNASPFNVNQIPTFGTVTVTDNTDGTIEPGDTLKFKLPEAQIDDDGTINMYICTEATTAFDYNTNTCTGGSLVCSDTAVDPDTEDAVCTGGADLVSVPTAHGSYDFKVYVEDNLNVTATGDDTQNYSVTDVPPTLTSYTATDAPEPSAGGSDTVDFSASISDVNGDNDVTAVEGIFFDDTAVNLVAGVCTPDEKNCYIHTACTLADKSTPGTGKTATGTDAVLTANCSVIVWFNANASTNWEVHVNPTDGLGKATGLADSNVNLENPELAGIDITQDSIAYGIIALGFASARQETNIGNMGNLVIDLMIDGNTMCTDYPTCSGSTLNYNMQKWYHTDTDFNWAATPTNPGPYTLVDTSSGTDDETGCLNRDIAVRPTHASTSTNESIWWKIKIPDEQALGTYTGENTFSSTASTTCSAGQAY